MLVGPLSEREDVTLRKPAAVSPRRGDFGRSPADGGASAPAESPGPRRLLSLDMLRGVAILLVLGRHQVAPAEGLGWFQPLAAGWTHIGWSGVDLFFVLSGFLVSGLLFSEYQRRGGVDVKRFMIRRGFKIWPPYLVYVALVAAWLGWKQFSAGGPGVWGELWPNLFHVQNYFHTPRMHTWSLAVEEHFYLAVALGFYLVLTRGHGAAVLRWLPVGVVAALIGLAALRTGLALRHGAAQLNLYATHLRFDGLLLGTLLAYWTHFSPERLAVVARRPGWAMAVGVALAAPTLWLAPEANAATAGVGLLALYVGYGLILIGWLNFAAEVKAGRRLLRRRPAAWLGAVGFFSYSIYLWHVDLAQVPLHKLALAARAAGAAPGLVWCVATLLYMLAAFAVGRLVGRLLEAPALALRDRLFPSRTPTPL
ncbi:acyltransferase [Opitutus sp. ER46]|uniref:acyltransferase family protein n=1 Tax=Opitutus sp. ER46 TaxID=2161864 RepID=UPI001304E6A8|nr:acyltransferase [Opitutus sp. ER46]